MCIVDPVTARIGDARSMLNDGIISHANAQARSRGVLPGSRCAEAIAAVQNDTRRPS